MTRPLRESLQTASWAQRHEEACIRTPLRPLPRATHHLAPVRQTVDQRRARAVLRGSWVAGHGSGPGSSPRHSRSRPGGRHPRQHDRSLFRRRPRPQPNRRDSPMTMPKIADHHLNRQACIYLRQSTPGQVRFNQESTERQYQLGTKASGLGWSPDHIRILDRDLGQSGKDITNRDDFKTLVNDVAMGTVGAVFAIEVSRLARSNQQWHRLLELCAITQTLVALSGFQGGEPGLRDG